MNVTKRDVLNALATIDFNDTTVGDVVVTAEDVQNFVETSLAQLDARSAKAAERAAEKKQAGDELRARIFATLTETPKTIAEIAEELDDPEVTNAKIVARLTQLCKQGEVFKSDVKVDSRTVKAYSTQPVEIVSED